MTENEIHDLDPLAGTGSPEQLGILFVQPRHPVVLHIHAKPNFRKLDVLIEKD